MKALSIRAPWWWFILHGGKDIENRDWPTRYRGPVLIHAARWWQRDEVEVDLDCCLRATTVNPLALPENLNPDYFKDVSVRGAIVGRVDIVGCVTKSDSPWFFGRFGFVLANPVAFKTPIPCKGSLGLFDVPPEIVQATGHETG